MLKLTFFYITSLFYITWVFKFIGLLIMAVGAGWIGCGGVFQP